MLKKRCATCGVYKPEEEVTYELRGRPSRKVRKPICLSCKESKASAKTIAERDAFGKKVSEWNSAEQSYLAQHFHTTKIRKENQ